MLKDFLQFPIINIFLLKTKLNNYILQFFESITENYIKKKSILHYENKILEKNIEKQSKISLKNLRKTKSYIYITEKMDYESKKKSYSDSYIMNHDDNDWGWFTDIE